MKSFGIAVTILLVGLLGCAAEDTQKAETDLSAFAVTSSVEGTDLGKFDAVSTISTWNVRESEHHTLLEGLNAAGNRKFGAIMETAPDSAVTNVQIIGETSCEAQLNLATLELVETTCTAAQINALEIPAIQLVDTFTPLLTDDAGKSDGYFTRAACVGAGIGAAVLTPWCGNSLQVQRRSVVALRRYRDFSLPVVQSWGRSLCVTTLSWRKPRLASA